MTMCDVIMLCLNCRNTWLHEGTIYSTLVCPDCSSRIWKVLEVDLWKRKTVKRKAELDDQLNRCKYNEMVKE